MNPEIEYAVFGLEIKGYNGKQISKKLNISESSVSRALNKVKRTREYELGVMSVTTFLEVFKRAGGYWNQSNIEYDDLIDKVNSIKLEDDMDGKVGEHIHTSKYDKLVKKLELISKLKEKQDDNMERIISLAKQGEVVLATRALRDVLRTYMPSDDEKQYLKIVNTDKITDPKKIELINSLRG